MTVAALPADALIRRCDPAQIPFADTSKAEAIAELPGQDRAAAAIRFGLGTRHKGYNLYVLGPPGSGRHSAIREFLERQSAEEPVPSDWCYVGNFEDPRRPRELGLPPGTAVQLRGHMAELVEELSHALLAVFEGEEFRARQKAIDEEIRELRGEQFEELSRRAREREIALVRTPTGFAVALMHDGDVLTPEQFEALPDKRRKKYEADLGEMEQALESTLRTLPDSEKNRIERIRDLSREVTRYAVSDRIEALRSHYREQENIVAYLNAVEEDVIKNARAFLVRGEQSSLPFPLRMPGPQTETDVFRRYEINVMVDNGGAERAPVVYEGVPSHSNLVGRIEHVQEMGALITDFVLIRSGALLKANGGYLVLDAVRVLTHPYAWEALKRALESGELRIESLGQALSLISTVSLEPEPIPLNLKIVLIGDRYLYYLPSLLDPDFPELFKVAADYGDEMDRSPGAVAGYAQSIAAIVRREGLRPFGRAAAARVIEHGSRLADDAAKLSARIGLIADLLRESDHRAEEAGAAAVTADHVQAAIDARIHRADRMRESAQESIRRGFRMIDTAGTAVGQVNGLSVTGIGDFQFGLPSRITARTRMGRGRVVDIEREVELGGPIHSKGVLILSGFLGARYALDRPLSLAASLVFEQSYGGVEGDSASSAELYALLSALAEVPLRQDLAVTGSVNQHGQVQAIGGVNEKIEGFFDVCAARGLDGQQGVLIPAANTENLMLRADVVAACAGGNFHVYPVARVDEGIELLTGLEAGERGEDGEFPEGSVNRKVEDRLRALADGLRTYGSAARGSGQDE